MKQRNRNEDEFGVIVDKTHQFDSLDKAAKYAEGLRDKLNRRADMTEFPVTTALPEDRLKYIDYVLSLMTKKNLPFTDEKKTFRCKAVLWLLSRGYTYEAISLWLKKHVSFKATVEKVKEVNEEAKKLAKEAISRVKGSKIPIVGG